MYLMIRTDPVFDNHVDVWECPDDQPPSQLKSFGTDIEAAREYCEAEFPGVEIYYKKSSYCPND